MVNGCGLVSPDLITAKTAAPTGVNVGMDPVGEVYEVARQRMGPSNFLSTLLGKTHADVWTQLASWPIESISCDVCL